MLTKLTPVRAARYCRDNDNRHDSWHSAAYRELSISLVKKAHPGYTDAEATAAAQTGFETAALNFFLETLKVCQEVRPNARWGAYGFMITHFASHCHSFRIYQKESKELLPSLRAVKRTSVTMHACRLLRIPERGVLPMRQQRLWLPIQKRPDVPGTER